jgi:hypothetical protein
MIYSTLFTSGIVMSSKAYTQIGTDTHRLICRPINIQISRITEPYIKATQPHVCAHRNTQRRKDAHKHTHTEYRHMRALTEAGVKYKRPRSKLAQALSWQ